MAHSTLAPPGTKYGPCNDDCAHIDCAETRGMATSLCRLCGQPIGYETPFYRDPKAAAETAWVHAACLNDEYERTRQKEGGTL